MCLKTRTNQVVLGDIGGAGHKVTILLVDKEDRYMSVFYADGHSETKLFEEGSVFEGVVAIYNLDESINGYIEKGLLLGQDGETFDVQDGDLRISGYIIPLTDIEIGLSI